MARGASAGDLADIVRRLDERGMNKGPPPALVVWGKDGEVRSAYDPGQGPVKAGVIPTLAGDALNRHVALDMAPPVLKS